MENSDLGRRMKSYERIAEYILPRRIPVIIRIDGRAFHTLTRNLKGWDKDFSGKMVDTAMAVFNDIQGCELVYIQSDEISFLLTDYKTINTQGWFGYDLRKLISISAGVASGNMSRLMGKNVCFDSRAFSLPQDEVCNYFIWRQQDATRNAIQMAGQEYFSPKQLHGKSCNEIQEMLFQSQNINFNDYPTARKRGICITNGIIDTEIPQFQKDRAYIEKFVNVRED